MGKEQDAVREWVYKATEAKIGYFETRHLAMAHHILCRSAVNENGNRADRVDEVEIGDIIHFYYKHKTKPTAAYGSFEVIDGSRYPVRFGRRIPGTALFEVLDTPDNAEMMQRLTEEHARDPRKGYQPDPEARCFTGWVIKRLDGHATPHFNHHKLFPGPMINLWRYPDAGLGKPRTKP